MPPSSSELFSAGQSLSNSSFAFFGDFNPYGLSFDDGRLADNTQHQINVTDNFSLIRGAHQLKFGIDYRRLRPEQRAAAYQQLFIFGSLPSVLANSAPFAAVISRTTDVQMVYVQLESLRSGHMENISKSESRLWSSVGVQHGAILSEWDSTLHSNPGNRHLDCDDCTPRDTTMACAKRRLRTTTRFGLATATEFSDKGWRRYFL